MDGNLVATARVRFTTAPRTCYLLILKWLDMPCRDRPVLDMPLYVKNSKCVICFRGRLAGRTRLPLSSGFLVTWLDFGGRGGGGETVVERVRITFFFPPPSRRLLSSDTAFFFVLISVNSPCYEYLVIYTRYSINDVGAVETQYRGVPNQYRGVPNQYRGPIGKNIYFLLCRGLSPDPPPPNGNGPWFLLTG